ncbi:MAG: hypothetical protein LBF79_02330 [Dysgonamonadaceae bacterium]|jgi:hypothetical protein|nr:hypothetical protein [Dysgonamonadaceae bacterium]
MKTYLYLILCTVSICACTERPVRRASAPSAEELFRAFGKSDAELFGKPTKNYCPETWFHYIGGNVSAAGITADLEAIAEAGFAGIQMFHGQFGGAWPEAEPQIPCLSPAWELMIEHTAQECKRLGLKFSMHNCPGWAMSGGPWIEPENAMRHLAWSRTDIEGGGKKKVILPIPKPDETWRDYRDVAVIAFPTPKDDTGEPLQPSAVKGNNGIQWKDLIAERNDNKPLKLPPLSGDSLYEVEITFPKPVKVRTVEFSSVQQFNHGRCYEPNVTVQIEAISTDGNQHLANVKMPQSNWQDDRPISIACNEPRNATTQYRIKIKNRYNMNIYSLRLFSAARKNAWESEAAWTLRSIVRENDNPTQSPTTFVRPEEIIDLSELKDETGNIDWEIPDGKWTILRIGHLNTGERNAPAPPEGTGWECDKLNSKGANAHFDGYIGRLTEGVLAGGLLTGIHFDSWECKTQTWTGDMETKFEQLSGYKLRKWLPALFGYVVKDHETTTRFLRDWRSVINHLSVNEYYGRFKELSREKKLELTVETAAGDVFPADILEYFKHADVPMCEFWQPLEDSFVGSINFKPIKPTASAARLYGKTRVAAEAFTSFQLTWDEHLSKLKEVANRNFIEGVTHLYFHTYTHNPRTDGPQPGTSFGEAAIGTPFLRGQTWWKHMKEFTTYIARLNYMLERGRPVSDVLWYLGDEIDHKPDQKAPFPDGYKYDYCNPDILLNRISVKNGRIVTPEGISYSLMWIPDNKRMLPETLNRLLELVKDGMILVADAPQSPATLSGGETAQWRFNAAVRAIWGEAGGETGSDGGRIRTVGKGKVLSGTSINDAVRAVRIAPDVTGGDAMWLHRRTGGADWYYICANPGGGFKGKLSFNNTENAEIWDPVSGEIHKAITLNSGDGRTSVEFDLAPAGSCFVVFRRNTEQMPARKPLSASKELTGRWTLEFPSGWGAPAKLETGELKAWKDLDLTPEAKAFSGTVKYTTVFNAGQIEKNTTYCLDLGRVEMIAEVTLNGRKLRTLWTPPYSIDITDALKQGENILNIEVTGTWFNRLVYDASLPEDQRKTWTFNPPKKDSPLRESGLLGPVELKIY